MGCNVSYINRELTDDEKRQLIRNISSMNRCIPTPADGRNIDDYRRQGIEIGLFDFAEVSARCSDTNKPWKDNPLCDAPAVDSGGFNIDTNNYEEIYLDTFVNWGIWPLPGILGNPPSSSSDDLINNSNSICREYLGPEWEAAENYVKSWSKFIPGPPGYRIWYYILGEHTKPGSTYNNIVYQGKDCGKHSQVYCRRKSYRGRVLPCCLREWPGQIWGRGFQTSTTSLADSNTDNCFEPNQDGTYNESRTCPPETTNPTGSVCAEAIANYCIGNTDILGNPTHFSQNDISWLNERWLEPSETTGGVAPCVFFMNQNASISNNSGFLVGSAIMNALLNRVSKFDQSINNFRNFTSTNAAQIWSIITNYCSTNPGMCDQGLFDFCRDYTYNDVLNNRELGTLCGCFLPQSEYDQYGNSVSVPRECSPACNRNLTIKEGDLNTRSWRQCERTLCVIDDVTITALNSNVDLDISQVCGGCGVGGPNTSTGCACIMSNLDFRFIDSNVKLQLEQQCSNIQCTYDIDGNVDCNTGIIQGVVRGLSQTQIVLIIVLLGLALLVGGWILVRAIFN